MKICIAQTESLKGKVQEIVQDQFEKTKQRAKRKILFRSSRSL
jgi:hypothetical protein